jgi:hypothetical protein
VTQRLPRRVYPRSAWILRSGVAADPLLASPSAPHGSRPCEDRPMKVGTPLGTYPFEFRRLERREGCVAIVGLVAGMESSVVFDSGDLRQVVRRLAPSLAVVALLVAMRRRSG